MIQEIAPHQYDNTYRPQKPEAEDYVLYYDGRAVLVTEGLHFRKSQRSAKRQRLPGRNLFICSRLMKKCTIF